MKRISLGKAISFPFRSYFVVFLGLNLAVIILVLSLQSKLPPVVPLFYGLPTGEEQLVPKMFLITPLLIAIAITIANIFILKITKEAFIQKVFVGLTLAVTLLAIITTVKIFFLVASF